ncbi:Transmembrane emp24 domain-containing protein [Vigna angularis]|uniref:Transmembrane emp24 domain-containing protein n=1 Tax=Phaseolus angularis TaxID=3914 RepID=A0A8T0KXV6_PHAAN|nr:Transmembrane emp24 domain-containing protein [Vigna angularis]
MSNLPLLMVFLLATALMCSIVESMMFELKSTHTKCISEDMKANTFSSGNYHVINPNSVGTVPDHHKITVRVHSPNGNGYHIGDNVLYGEFAFTAAESGDYSACFSVVAHTTDTVTINFVWKTGVAAKDWNNGGRKSHIDEMEMELKKLNDAVTSIHDEMFYLRERYKFIVSAYKFTGAIGLFDLVNNVSPCDLMGIGFCFTHSKSLNAKCMKRIVVG